MRNDIAQRRPDSWESFFALDATADVPPDFMSEDDRAQGEHTRDPFQDGTSASDSDDAVQRLHPRQRAGWPDAR